MHTLRLLLVATLVSVGIVTTGATAAADCAGPGLDYAAGDVAPGDTVTVTGRAFGTDCYDTGSPPDGEGGLGKPQTEIELYVVQGEQTSAMPYSTADVRFETEILVATGAADADYVFATEITIPYEVRPGPAAIIARWGDTSRTFDPLPLPLTVVEPDGGALSEPQVGEVTTFGPVDPAPTATTEQEFSLEPDVVDDSTPLGPVVAVIGILIVGGVVGIWLFRRRRRRRVG